MIETDVFNEDNAEIEYRAHLKDKAEINKMTLSELISSLDNDMWKLRTNLIDVIYKGKRNYLRWNYLRELIILKYNHQCAKCGMHREFNKILYGRDLSVHHIIPLYKGGNTHPENLIAYCDVCHKKEHRGFDLWKYLNDIKQSR